MEAWRSGFSKGCWSTAVPLLTPSGLLMEASTRDIASLARTPLGHLPVFAIGFWQRTAPVSRHYRAHANSCAADPGGGRRWQPMTVDVASRRRLNDVNESFQHPGDEMVVDHPLIPLKLSSVAKRCGDADRFGQTRPAAAGALGSRAQGQLGRGRPARSVPIARRKPRIMRLERPRPLAETSIVLARRNFGEAQPSS